ncbi:MAG: alpha/beta hydrolase [Sphingobacterium sp.]|nr:alpha/beta hydrolase [Sphingobacterium sp.]
MSRKKTFRKMFLRVWIALGIFLILWIVYSYQAHGVDGQLLETSIQTEVNIEDDFYLFTPRDQFKDVMLFYPGAMVDPKAYVPLCRALADHDIQVYLFKMPWRMASKGYLKPIDLNIVNDSTKTYILAGHSQGGKMAAQFVYENPTKANKLILIGTSHPREISLSNLTIPVLKIAGTNDGIATPQSIEANRNKLPSTAQFVRIEGGNHSQFGYYGFQMGDNKSSISREQQHSEVVKNILEFIK